MYNKKIGILILTCVTIVSCAKKEAYDTVYKKAELESKSSIKISKKTINRSGQEETEPVKYLYVPMTLGTPRQVKQANPFYQGDEKIVRLKWAKDGLKVLEMELDDRYSDNDLNEVPVMTIPGEYRSYRCERDSYGDCTNAEEENEDITWDQKQFFEPDFAKLDVEEVNMLDLANVEGDSCVSLEKTALVDYELNDGVINVELEKTYRLKNSWNCIRNNYYEDKLSYNSFKVRFFYSMVELDKLATKGYEKVDYPVTDHDKFGYFKDEKSILGDVFDTQRKIDQVYLNRWSTKRKNNKLTYYLSKTFNKPENKELLDATFRATEVMNRGFAEANMPFQLEMIQQTEDMKEVSPGDLRYNTVVLIDDPLANGLLGYGPTVSNPLTGEIVQGHVNMYGGVLTSTVRRVYDSAVDLSIKQKKKEKIEVLTDIKVSKEALDNVPATLIAKSDDIVKAKALSVSTHNDELEYFNIDSYKKMEAAKTVNPKIAYQNLVDSDFEGLDMLEKKFKVEEAHEKGLALDSEHAPEFFEIGGTVKRIPEQMLAIDGIKKADGTLKRWNMLSNSQKTKVKKIILVESYISTFVHEFGHNLGLRHNFSGSFDKDNFYSESEAKNFGMKAAPAYSSVMDYAYSNFNELAAFGKYDVAALRFGYAREVETEDGKFVKVDETYTKTADKLKLKAYAFCTDENAGLNTSCNRFDEGTTLVEITKHKVQRYKEAYKYRNFRDGRNVFNTYGLVDYLLSRYSEFSGIRDILEDYETFVGLFGAGVMNNGCSEEQSNDPQTKNICAMIKDRVEAVKIVGDFFVEILKTPDHLCALSKKDAPNVIVKLEKLAEVYEGIKYQTEKLVTSCFDPAVTAKFDAEDLIVVGENGKFLNSIKGTDPRYKYTSDRDVRGVWIDKVLAMRLLFERTNSRTATDSANMALMDVGYIQNKVLPLIAHLSLGDKLQEPLPFKTKDAKQFTIPYYIADDYKIDQVEGYFYWIKQFFGMPMNGKASLTKTTLNQVVEGGLSFGDETLDDAYQLINFTTVKKISSYVATTQNGSTSYYTDGSFTYGAMEENAIAKHLIDVLNNKDFLLSLDSKIAAKILKQRTSPEAPSDLSDGLKAFFSIGAADQKALADYRAQGVPIPDATFIQIFGKELGEKIAIAYKEEAQILYAVAQMKQMIMTTPAKDATQIEKKLFDISTRILDMKVKGQINEALIKFYKAQLKKLPNHVDYTNV